MARILPLIIALFGAAAYGGWTEDAIAAYRSFQKQISEAHRAMSPPGDFRQRLVDLNVKRDALDAQYPYRPKESAALTAERRRTDVAFKGLTHAAKSSQRQTASKAVPPSAPQKSSPKKKRAKRK